MTEIDDAPIRWLAAATEIAASTGPAQGMKTSPEAQAQHEPTARAGVTGPTQPVERQLYPASEGGQQQSRGQYQQEGDPEPEEEVLGQAEGAQHRTTDQLGEAEAHHQSGDDQKRTGPGSGCRPAGHNHREDRDDARRQPRYQPTQESDRQQFSHVALKLPASAVQRASARRRDMSLGREVLWKVAGRPWCRLTLSTEFPGRPLVHRRRAAITPCRSTCSGCPARRPVQVGGAVQHHHRRPAGHHRRVDHADRHARTSFGASGSTRSLPATASTCCG